MEQEPEDGIKEFEMRFWSRLAAWQKALGEHCPPEPGSERDLARGVDAWRRLEAGDPAWREKDAQHPFDPQLRALASPELQRNFELFVLKKHALSFEQQLYKALLEGGKKGQDFARQLSKAFDPGSISWRSSLAQEVLWTWFELTFQRLNDVVEGRRDEPTQPTMREIQIAIEHKRQEQQLRSPSPRNWERIWEDPFIAALLRCP